MKRIPVESSNLASVGYDPTSKVLEIEFKTARIYEYYDVPQDEYDGLMVASSHGSYFYHNIRNGGYRYHKIR